MKTKTVTLKHGLKIGEAFHTDVELREPTLGDMIEAEKDAPASQFIGFRSALIAHCIFRVGGQSIPVSTKLLRQLKPIDYGLLSDAVGDFDTEGEA